ncbi:MAG: hypothetical protein KGI26_03965 [Thaumarchaeota archaeon]|nr:hypothetical protein [Nitrososphaerota archaeon]
MDKSRRRPASVRVLQSVIDAVGALHSAHGPSFNDILGHLRADRTIANHRSLRSYLDLLVAAGSVRVRIEPSRSNVRPRQVYALTSKGPFAQAGEGAVSRLGVAWDLGSEELVRVKLDLEGVARGTLDAGVLYCSAEDALVDALAGARGADAKALSLTYSAALAVSNRLDEEYLLRRARARGVEAEVAELLAELRSLFYAPRVPARDVKTLYLVRRALPPLRRGGTLYEPKWTLFSPDVLLDVVGKQLGVK